MMKTTSTGTTVEVRPIDAGGETIDTVVVDHPTAPADMRYREVGRIIDGGYQPAPFASWTLYPETLRTIADLVEEVSR